SKAGYTFSPVSTSFNPLDGNKTANFTTLNTISGQVTLNSAGLAGISVTLSGCASATTSTDSSGNYSFSGLSSGGSCTVTPSKAGYYFRPPSTTISPLNGPATATFATNHTVSGQVTEAGIGVSGVSLVIGNGPFYQMFATTDTSGNYAVTSPWD